MAEGDMASLADHMNTNFDLRRSIFGDDALGATNLHMISLARSVGGEFGYEHIFCFSSVYSPPPFSFLWCGLLKPRPTTPVMRAA